MNAPPFTATPPPSEILPPEAVQLSICLLYTSVLIDHQNGLYSLYAHCSALYVAAGQGVSRGQQIAAVGRTGNASGNHLHLEVWTDPSGARWCLANPLSYVTPP